MVQDLLSSLAMMLRTPKTVRRFRTAGILLLILASFSAARAQNLDPAEERGQYAGKYRCVRLEMDQKTAPCQSPPLVLNEDGSYQIWGEEGSYELVQGRWLVLEHSQRRGLGRIVNAREIVFEYRVGDKKCKVTFQRIFEPPPGYSLG
jgi:hypothetical protein